MQGRPFTWTDDELTCDVRQQITDQVPDTQTLMMRPLKCPA